MTHLVSVCRRITSQACLAPRIPDSQRPFSFLISCLWLHVRDQPPHSFLGAPAALPVMLPPWLQASQVSRSPACGSLLTLRGCGEGFMLPRPVRFSQWFHDPACLWQNFNGFLSCSEKSQSLQKLKAIVHITPLTHFTVTPATLASLLFHKQARSTAPQGLCTCSSLCLECSSPRFPHGSPPHCFAVLSAAMQANLDHPDFAAHHTPSPLPAPAS